jgi:uncharacterized protein YyaL (SSP411 family)
MPQKTTTKTSYKLPQPSIEHLKRLTDDTGILQHAKYIIPDRQNGYCTDDNARALIVTAKYYKQHPEPAVLRLFETYLSFLYHALKPDKTVHNFLDYNRNWQTGKSEHDTLGRTIWAFGSVIASPPNDDYIPIVREFFYDTCQHISSLPAKSASYAILGLSEFLNKFPSDKQATELLTKAADILFKNYNKYTSSDWMWFEDILSYANAILPAAMYAAAKILNNQTYLETAEKSCSFLLENTFNGKHFSFIGSNGWYLKGKKRAQFDQQPIEGADTVIMLANAYQVTKSKKYLDLQKKAFGWFLGENDINRPLYDPKTKGCCDGLGADGVNINQGAESIVSFLLAQLSLI